MGQERLGPSYFFISLVLGPPNSLVWYVPSLRYTRGLGWRIYYGVEVTESSTNKQQITHSLSCSAASGSPASSSPEFSPESASDAHTGGKGRTAGGMEVPRGGYMALELFFVSARTNKRHHHHHRLKGMIYITLVDSYQHLWFTPQICVHIKNVCLTLFSIIHTIKCGSHHAHVITPKEYCSHQKKYCSHPNSEDSYH